MIIEIEKLIRVVVLINSEGTILGLLKDKSDKLFLCSYLKNKNGTVYFSTTKNILLDYLNGNLKTEELFLKSDSFLVTIKSEGESKSYIKENLKGEIQFGALRYSEISSSMKCENPFQYL